MIECQSAALPLHAAALEATDTEAEAIARARRDRAAFGHLYQAHYRAVAGCIYRRVGDVHVAEDLAADVFIAAFRGLHRYRDRGTPFRYWLLRIATNRVHRWARSQRRVAATERAAVPADPAPRGAAEAEEVRAAVARLTPRHQAVVSLHYFEQMSIEQVAKVLACSPGTVKSRLARARAALRPHLEPHSQQGDS
ncbi:MAG: RNA polymerase sigma factor [Phycisphaerales bacterium]|nr:RNA polymerase sigma factor [Phycisphaerales bacterium]